jgi:hypothetical protein
MTSRREDPPPVASRRTARDMHQKHITHDLPSTVSRSFECKPEQRTVRYLIT